MHFIGVEMDSVSGRIAKAIHPEADKPIVDVEGSMTAFGRSLGMETNGQQLRSLKDQLARLAAATVRLGVVEEGRAVQVNTQFVSAFELWTNKQSEQRLLWPSTVCLSEEYFQSLGKHAVPLDPRAVAILSSSSMALDVYAWLAQRLHRVPPGRPQMITWISLHAQFGQGFARVRDFRKRFLHTLQQVKAAYPNARLDASEVGLTLQNSPPPVPRRFATPLSGPKTHGNLVAPSNAIQSTVSATESEIGRVDEGSDKLLNVRESVTWKISRPRD